VRGEAVCDARVRSSCVYSLVASSEMLVAAGASSWIDVFSPSLDQNYTAIQFAV
jgi:hypothetical protein